MTSARLLACILVAGVAPAWAWAQCPNGAPPPCAVPPPAPPDSSRIAVFPFHVTSADTLLGEGVAELLATELTGEQGPRAAHVGTVLRAWRRAGGNLRTPLSQGQATRLARELDAGWYVEGTVVGVGSRLTLTASAVVTMTGMPRRVGPFSGPADSFEVLVGRLAAGLLTASGGERPTDARVHLTDSPAAMTAYLAGLRAYRHLRLRESATAFGRALDIDSTFARAAFMRYLVGAWLEAGTAVGAAQAWSLRDRLPRQDRLLLAADLGERYPEGRSPQAHLAELRRAVERLPESPEARYLLGDYLYHSGAANAISDGFREARTVLEQSVALDSQATLLRHLVEIGLYTADTALLLRVFPAFDRIADPSVATSFGAVVAERTGDSALAAAMRRRGALRGGTSLYWAMFAALPGESILRLRGWSSPTPQTGALNSLEYRTAAALLMAGRPRDAVRQRVEATAPLEVDYALVMGALFADGDPAAARQAAVRLASAASAASELLQHRAACARALWLMREGATPSFDAVYLRGHREGPCATMLELLRAERDGAADLGARIAAADSMIRWNIAGGTFETLGYENLILARLWESRGDAARALEAVRLRSYGTVMAWSEVEGARVEGRLAAQAGDTAAAIRAYRRYLDFRRDAEPALLPQRDSVRAAMERLLRQ